MEIISIGSLPKGTRKKLKKIALEKGFTKENGTVNVSLYLRGIIFRDIKEWEKP